MKYLQSKSPINLDKPPDHKTAGSAAADQNHQNKGPKKHERPRAKIYQNETEGSRDDILDADDEEVSNVYRKISERREELNRARRNGDDCHVS